MAKAKHDITLPQSKSRLLFLHDILPKLTWLTSATYHGAANGLTICLADMQLTEHNH